MRARRDLLSQVKRDLSFLYEYEDGRTIPSTLEGLPDGAEGCVTVESNGFLLRVFYARGETCLQVAPVWDRTDWRFLGCWFDLSEVPIREVNSKFFPKEDYR
jgi:hypothetical protein